MGWFGSSKKSIEKSPETNVEKRKREENRVVKDTKKALNDLKKDIKK